MNEVQPVKRPNIEHRKLVCVLMPRADRYMSQGEMSQGRSVSKAPKVTVWNIQSLCEHCAFAVSGSCVKVSERRVPDGRYREYRWGSCFVQVSSRSPPFNR
ncbi:hypothetical protein K0M31_014960 [Melipona bicolor]|uniref:Uncharacterized protein n=1 Tax=Melipona bicolor TaxID=60889 RepID=A0AA40FGL9_9HYME|nr:hypothetical protein K0M31_014960 [Melipona bicolor]